MKSMLGVSDDTSLCGKMTDLSSPSASNGISLSWGFVNRGRMRDFKLFWMMLRLA